MSNDLRDEPRPEDIAALAEQIDAARAAEAELLTDTDQDEAQGDAPDQRFLSQCFAENERGDGQLFARLQRDEFLFIKTVGEWLIWTGHHWAIDKKDRAHDAVDQVARQFIEQLRTINEQIAAARAEDNKDQERGLSDLAKKYHARIKKLRSLTGAKSCLEWAHKIGDDSLAIVGDELDQKPWLLPCSNGVLNLKTGELCAGDPADHLVKAIPIEWQGFDAPRPSWEKFIKEIHLEDDEVVAFVQRLFGYSLTGLTTEHFIACFVGEGRNGKGTLFETLRHLMGELAWNVNPEMILEQKTTRSSAGPSPDMVSLQGRRLVVASETDENRRISGAKVKALTGSDTINARAPHDRFETNFIPTHKLFLYTNHIPLGLTKDYALAKRLLLLQYPLKYIDDPTEENERQRDPELPAKLLDEAPGILAWLVEGCLLWQELGLAPPDKIKSDVEQLRIAQDNFGRFFDETLVVTETDLPVLFGDIYTKYKEWYQDEISENERWLDSKIKISKWLEKKGLRKDKKGGPAKVYGCAFKVFSHDDL